MPRASNADWNLAQTLYVQGVPYRAIAEKVGVTQTSLRQRAHRYKWQALKTVALETVSQAVTGHNGRTLTERSAAVRSMLADELAGSANALRQLPIEVDLPHLNERAEVSGKLVGASNKVFGWSESADSGGFGLSLRALDAVDVEEVKPFGS